MTKLCNACGKHKPGNDTEHLITFDDNLTLTLRSSFFDNPDSFGTIYNFRSITVNSADSSPIEVAVKWSREQHSCDSTFHFLSSLKACDEACRVISAFLDTVDTDGWKINVVKPILLECSDMELSVEPFVNDVVKFSEASDLGQPALGEVADIINAMGHFSYIFSKGKYVITNLKGGIIESRLTITLVSPTLLSNRQGYFGCDDLGSIRKHFFSKHVCNSLCEGMKRPRQKSPSGPEDSEDLKLVFTPLVLKKD